MTINEYQKLSRKTADYPLLEQDLLYPVLGLVGESGEVAEKVKKLFRDDAGRLTERRRELIIKELGDVLWYLAQIATELKIDLDEVAQRNLDKLLSRQERNKINGNGDDR